MIISVGYRVKSQQGITFRKWATNVLKDYMLKGYAVLEIFIKVLHGQDIYKSIEEIRNVNNEVIERRIYILDNSVSTYCSKKQYPYCQNNQYPIDDNIKKNNINLKIDRLYYCVINNQMDYYDELNQDDKQVLLQEILTI